MNLEELKFYLKHRYTNRKIDFYPVSDVLENLKENNKSYLYWGQIYMDNTSSLKFIQSKFQITDYVDRYTFNEETGTYNIIPPPPISEQDGYRNPLSYFIRLNTDSETTFQFADFPLNSILFRNVVLSAGVSGYFQGFKIHII